MEIIQSSQDPNDQSSKYVLKLDNGHLVEGVYLPDPRFYGFCASSQVGCNMGCTFCATALQRNIYNLTATEIVEQVVLMKSKVTTDLPFDFVTLAGMGEPLANYSNSVQALEIIRESYPSLTVASLSTVGLIKGIKRLSKEGRTFRLYLSLHATTDEIRRTIIPIAEQYPLIEVVDAVSEYGERNGASACRVSYLLLRGVNDTPSDLLRLKNILKGRPLMLQILLWNEVPSLPFKRVDDRVADQWCESLRGWGIDAYIMRSMGRSIDAACGQLQNRARAHAHSPLQ